MASKNQKFSEGILSFYFSKEEIAEFKKRLRTSNAKGKSEIPSVTKKNKNQLESTFEPVDKNELDLLLTFIDEKLSKQRRVDCLFLVGEHLQLTGDTESCLLVYEQLLELTLSDKTYQNTSAQIYLKIAETYSRQARWRQSISNLNKAIKLFDLENDYRGRARGENMLGTIYGDMGKFAKAKEHFLLSLNLLDPFADATLYLMLEMNIGILNMMAGNYDEAYSYFQRALVKAERVNHPFRKAELKHNMGMFFYEKEDYNAALSEFDGSIALFTEYYNISGVALAYIGKASVYIQTEDLELANAFIEKSMEYAYRINDRLTIADGFKLKGVIERELTNYEIAETFLHTSLRINRELENILNTAETSFEMGLLYKEIKKTDAAIIHFKKALKAYTLLNNAKKIKKVNELLKDISVPGSVKIK